MPHLEVKLKGFEGMTGDESQFVHNAPNTYKKSVNFIPQRDKSLVNRNRLEKIGIEVLDTDKVTCFTVNRKTYFAVYDSTLHNRFREHIWTPSNYRGNETIATGGRWSDVRDPSNLSVLNVSLEYAGMGAPPTGRNEFKALYERDDHGDTTSTDFDDVGTIYLRSYANYLSSVTAMGLITFDDLGLVEGQMAPSSFEKEASAPIRQIRLWNEKSSMWWQRFVIYDEEGNQVTQMIMRPTFTTENTLEVNSDVTSDQLAASTYLTFPEFRKEHLGTNPWTYDASVSPEGLIVFTNKEGVLPPLITRIREFRENSEDERFNVFGSDDVGIVCDLRSYYFRNNVHSVLKRAGFPVPADPRAPQPPEFLNLSQLFVSWGADYRTDPQFLFTETPEYDAWWTTYAEDKDNRYANEVAEATYQLMLRRIASNNVALLAGVREINQLAVREFDAIYANSHERFTEYNPEAGSSHIDRNPFFQGARTYTNKANTFADSDYVFEGVDFEQNEVLMCLGLREDFLSGDLDLGKTGNLETKERNAAVRRRYLLSNYVAADNTSTLADMVAPVPLVLRKNNFRSHSVAEPLTPAFGSGVTDIGLRWDKTKFKNVPLLASYIPIPYTIPGHYYRHSGYTEGRRVFGGGGLDPDQITFSAKAAIPPQELKGQQSSTPASEAILRRVNGEDLGLDFSPYAFDIRNLALGEGTGPTENADRLGNNTWAAPFRDRIGAMPTLHFGARVTLVYPSGRLELAWMTTIRHVLWVGTEAGSIPLKGLTSGFVPNLADDTSFTRSDDSSQFNHAPIVGRSLLFQVSDDGQSLFAIEDSLELRRRVYASASESIEADAFAKDPIVQAASNRALGSLFLRSQSGKIYYGLIVGQAVRWTELQFEAPVRYIFSQNVALYVVLTNGVAGKVRLNVKGPIEAKVPLTLEFNCAQSYKMDDAQGLVKPQHFLDTDNASMGTLLGRFSGKIGLGTGKKGRLSKEKPCDNSLSLSDTDTKDNRDSMKLFFEEDREVRLTRAHFYIKI